MIIIKKCLHCNEEFKTWDKKQIFCSCKCAQYYRAIGKSKIEKCLICGEEIRVYKCEENKKKYCSVICQKKGQKITQKGEKNSNFGNHKLKGRIKTSKELEKQSKGATIAWQNPERLKKQKLALEKYKEENGFYPMQSEQSKEKRQKSWLKTIEEKDVKLRCRGVSGYYISSKTLRREYYMSTWELIRMQELDKETEVIFWTKKHKIHIALSRKRNYLPDFYIEYKNEEKVLEEVKGYIRDKELFEEQIRVAQVYCQEKKWKFKINFMNHLRKTSDFVNELDYYEQS